MTDEANKVIGKIPHNSSQTSSFFQSPRTTCVPLTRGVVASKGSPIADVSCVPLAADTKGAAARSAETLWEHFVSLSRASVTMPAVKCKESPTLDEKLHTISESLKIFKLDSSEDEVFMEQPGSNPRMYWLYYLRIAAKMLT